MSMVKIEYTQCVADPPAIFTLVDGPAPGETLQEWADSLGEIAAGEKGSYKILELNE